VSARRRYARVRPFPTLATEAPISFRSVFSPGRPSSPEGADPRWFRTGPAAPPPGAPVFVLVHGVGLSHRSFSRLAASLAGHGSVLAPDLPGFGEAAGPGRRVGVDELVEALLPRLDQAAAAAGVDAPLVVLGHSLGAQIATEIARRRPDAVRALVLVGPVVDPQAWGAWGQGRRLALDMWGEPPLTAVMVGRDYARGGLFSFAAGVRSMLRYDTLGRLAGVTVPVLVLRGEHDPIAPSEWVTRLAAATSRGRTVEVEGAVHNVVHSHADEVSGHVVAFAVEAARGR
jgi:pimeloyl-ACP methyl ester carboxylesterase